jgi:hypothetical protein
MAKDNNIKIRQENNVCQVAYENLVEDSKIGGLFSKLLLLACLSGCFFSMARGDIHYYDFVVSLIKPIHSGLFIVKIRVMLYIIILFKYAFNNP